MAVRPTIHVGDVLAVLRTLPDASVQCCVTDPPYGECNASWDRPRSREWHEAWLREAARIVVPNGPFVVFGSRRYLDILMGAMRTVLGDTSERPMQSAVWVHRQGFQSRQGFLRPEHEPIVCSGSLRATEDEVRQLRAYQTPHNVARKPTVRRGLSRGFKEYTYVPHAVGPMAGTVIESSRNKGKAASGHPTEKPEAVMQMAVLLASAPGTTVLDPFTGSGTTGVVAVKHGRCFVGIELNPEYAEIARRRVAAAEQAYATELSKFLE